MMEVKNNKYPKRSLSVTLAYYGKKALSIILVTMVVAIVIAILVIEIYKQLDGK